MKSASRAFFLILLLMGARISVAAKEQGYFLPDVVRYYFKSDIKKEDMERERAIIPFFKNRIWRRNQNLIIKRSKGELKQYPAPNQTVNFVDIIEKYKIVVLTIRDVETHEFILFNYETGDEKRLGVAPTWSPSGKRFALAYFPPPGYWAGLEVSEIWEIKNGQFTRMID